MEIKRTLITFTAILAFAFFAFYSYADGEIIHRADMVNYWDSANHTVSVTNTGNETTNVTIAIPSGWSFTSGEGCSVDGTDIVCIISEGGTSNYTVQSPGSASSEYDVDIFQVTTNNTFTGNNVSMLKIQCNEIFHTLVEYGRGRGNYFYNSGSGAAGSGQTEEGCSFLPDNSRIELNFLHKIYNVKQYFGVVADAYNASYTCTYPNSTIVRQHLDTSVTRTSSAWELDYFISEITGSWERFGYLGMQFGDTEFAAGQNITINCTDIRYYLPVAGGDMSCAEDSFTLQFVDREPFTVSATAGAGATVGNGTQEVPIVYTITNSESYDVTDVIIEISAPDYADFIGVRGELWGTARDTYRIELTDLLAGESEIITLIARFDTTTASGITSINLTEGVDISYMTCWETNAYNPSTYIQTITANTTGAGAGIGNVTFNPAVNTSIINIINYINNTYNIVYSMNMTIGDINSTVNDIWNLSVIMNSTINRINTTITQINTTVTNIYNDTQNILALVNCTAAYSPICSNLTAILDKLDSMNTTISEIQTTVNEINTTVNNIWNLSVVMNETITNIEGNVTVIFNNTNRLLELMNCSNTTGDDNNSICNVLLRIENDTINIINNITNIWGNYTAQNIIDAINNISVNINLSTQDINRILTEISNLREFDEELVFLVTDAFNANQRARSSADSGDYDTAASSLQEATTKLQQAEARLSEIRQEATVEKPGITGVGTQWWIWLVLVGLIVMTVVYLFQKVPEDKKPPREDFRG